jgi:CRISPR-associated protein Csb2
VRETVEQRFVVTNRILQKGGNQHHLGRTNGVRVRSGVVVGEPTFALVWPDATPPDAVRQTLARLARAVPYVGRSSCEARVRVLDTRTERDGWRRYLPAGLDEPGEPVRVPYSGFTDALRQAYADGRRAHLTTREVVYVEARPEPVPEGPVMSPFSELLIYAFEQPYAPIDGRHLVRVTWMLRKAVHERICRKNGAPPKHPREVLPPAVSGRDAGRSTHVAFLALPHVEHAHADGRLMGVALAIPRDMNTADRRVLLDATVLDELRRLRLFRSVDLSLRLTFGRASGETRHALQPERWVGREGGHTAWSTATPIALDHFTRSRDLDAELVAAAAVNAGYPEPVEVEACREPLVPGAIARPSLGVLPPHRRRPLVHARLRFAEPVAGPVVIGSLRFLGVGLCVPSDRRAASREPRIMVEEGS